MGTTHVSEPIGSLSNGKGGGVISPVKSDNYSTGVCFKFATILTVLFSNTVYFSCPIQTTDESVGFAMGPWAGAEIQNQLRESELTCQNRSRGRSYGKSSSPKTISSSSPSSSSLGNKSFSRRMLYATEMTLSRILRGKTPVSGLRLIST